MSQSEASEPPSNRAERIGVVILAAGQGTRMHARLPKVLHPIAGLPMVRRVVEIGRSLDPSAIALVVGHAAERVAAAAGPGLAVVEQHERLGTGHAVLQAREAMQGTSDVVVVLYADTALIHPATLQRMIAATAESPLTLLTVERGVSTVYDAITASYGRIERDAGNRIVRILELPGSPIYDTIREVNTGVMAFRAAWLWEHVARLPCNSNGEFFLTDLVAAAAAEGHRVAAVQPAEMDEILGVNTQAQLAEVNRIALERIRAGLLDKGVRMLDPSTVYVDFTVAVGSDVVLHPNTHLRGRTSVGAGTEVGPNSIVEDTTIGEGCRVVASVLEQAWVGNRASIGPFAHLRPGAHIEDEVELGNYAEVKASTIGHGTRMHHFSYIGDASIGRGTNVGAGTITCNFDGQNKHRTVVGEGVFIGSDSMLVAPVTLGDGARTGAGSVVTHDVAPGQLVVGVPARPKTPGGSGASSAAQADSPPAIARHGASSDDVMSNETPSLDVPSQTVPRHDAHRNHAPPGEDAGSGTPDV
ncbi:MAG: bifunctional UDP-N-acetylglucosamine diphosphorylase/glucosamine-1-phosphate N-acetyltransferase GlmU [Chloroflexi bacterium]|nr:bifunctional UDP-N-acetylglucosamine diphosphorylase/glucosamine-1-phosphate N-acetyltransferase GlmU [Chloroflexota bacterium]